MKTILLTVLQGDITKIAVDAIVNAANSSLLGGGGVDGAIHRAGGPAILEDCRAIRARQGGCKVGEAVLTTAGLLPARLVIHTVGPVWNGGAKGEPEALARAYYNCLVLAQAHGLARVSFPGISTGIYKFPKRAAAEIAVATVRAFAAENTVVEEVVFVAFDAETAGIYAEVMGAV